MNFKFKLSLDVKRKLTVESWEKSVFVPVVVVAVVALVVLELR